MRGAFCGLVIAALNIAVATALVAQVQPPVDAAEWVVKYQGVPPVQSSNAVFWLSLNQSLVRASPINGAVLWQAPLVHPFVIQFTMAATATDKTVAMYCAMCTFGRRLMVFNATTGSILVNVSKPPSDCSTSLVPLGASHFVCTGVNGALTSILDHLGNVVWSTATYGLRVSGSMNTVSSSGVFADAQQVVYFIAIDRNDDTSLIVIHLKDGTMHVLPNIQFISANEVFGGTDILALSTSSSVAVVLRVNVFTLDVAWNQTLSGHVTGTTTMVLTGGTGVLMACTNEGLGCALMAFDMPTGSLFVNETFTWIVQVSQLSSQGGLLVGSLVNASQHVFYGTYDVGAGKWIAMKNIAGSQFTPLPVTGERQIIAWNDQGYVRADSKTLAVKSMNLALPGALATAVFTDMPTVGKTTVITATDLFVNNTLAMTAIVF